MSWARTSQHPPAHHLDLLLLQSMAGTTARDAEDMVVHETGVSVREAWTGRLPG